MGLSQSTDIRHLAEQIKTERSREQCTPPTDDRASSHTHTEIPQLSDAILRLFNTSRFPPSREDHAEEKEMDMPSDRARDAPSHTSDDEAFDEADVVSSDLQDEPRESLDGRTGCVEEKQHTKSPESSLDDINKHLFDMIGRIFGSSLKISVRTPVDYITDDPSPVVLSEETLEQTMDRSNAAFSFNRNLLNIMIFLQSPIQIVTEDLRYWYNALSANINQTKFFDNFVTNMPDGIEEILESDGSALLPIYPFVELKQNIEYASSPIKQKIYIRMHKMVSQAVHYILSRKASPLYKETRERILRYRSQYS
jgi:hypothetical protein